MPERMRWHPGRTRIDKEAQSLPIEYRGWYLIATADMERLESSFIEVGSLLASGLIKTEESMANVLWVLNEGDGTVSLHLWDRWARVTFDFRSRHPVEEMGNLKLAIARAAVLARHGITALNVGREQGLGAMERFMEEKGFEPSEGRDFLPSFE